MIFISNGEKNEEKEELSHDEIIKPSVRSRPGFLLERGKAKLSHPRNELWKWIISHIKPYKLHLLIFLILLLIGTIISSISPAIVANIIDYGIVKKDEFHVIIVGFIYLLLLIVMAIVTYFSQYGMGKISQKVTFNIRNELFTKLQKISIEYHDMRSSGDIMSVLTNDVTLLNQLVGGQLIQIINSVILIAITIIIMFMLNPFLTLISFIIFPIFYGIISHFRNVAIKLFKESRKTIGKVTSSIQENIAGAKVVKAYGQEEKASREFDKANKENYEIMVRIRNYIATIFPLITLITTVLTGFIIFIGGVTIIGHIKIFGISVSVGVLSAFITILGQFFRPFMILMQFQQVIESAIAASDRIYSLIKANIELPDPSTPKSLNSIKGEIVFKNVYFKYKTNLLRKKSKSTEQKNQSKPQQKEFRYVFKDLNLRIQPDQTVAIVGETGSGKTTLIKLLARLYDVDKGSILIDGIDIRHMRKEDLRKMIEISKFLGLHDFIEAIHDKYDKKLKENGANISIGQRQLIAFARALLTEPKILILDEATSSVDPYTETLIQNALNKARKGRTTIIIAHRLSDHIIVLDANNQGIIEQGDHDSLLELNGKYKRLLEMQHREIKIS
ncbi:MAG: ABC transporter ATP-binding protein [Promethearchaeota archaeon]